MDLKLFLLKQMAFSHATFGKGTRTKGVIDHIRKELIEVEESNGSPEEWVDVVLLALDGLTRQLKFNDGREHDSILVVRQASSLLSIKLAKNMDRDWPDLRETDPDKAIEHVKEPADGQLP